MFEPARPFACIAIAFGMLIGSIGGPTAASAQTTYLRVPSYEPKSTAIVMDAKTGEVLYAERADSPRYPASVTKLMTFYLAFESLATGRLHLGDMIVVSPHAAAQPATKLGLRSGETIRVEDALHAMAVHSANDMAVAVAERIGGTESEFAAQMTLKAQQLGMLNTRYVNANGLPDNRQISSARDIAILARAIITRNITVFLANKSSPIAARQWLIQIICLERCPEWMGLRQDLPMRRDLILPPPPCVTATD